ncbi:MAG: hypothetical protein RJQ14_02845 [Marinoscillum sp.]
MLKNLEIILISSSTADAQWIINTLKRSELNNELIWIKDTDRAFDYLSSQGLYSGKALTQCNKVFVLDNNFPEAESIKGLIKSNESLECCQILDLAEGRKRLGDSGDTSDSGVTFNLMSTLQSLAFALL